MKEPSNRAINILLATNGLVLVAAAMLGPIYALFVEEVGGDLFDASSAFGIFAFTAGMATLLSGEVADRIKEKKYIVALGYIIIGTGFFSYLLVDSIVSLFAVQVIIGLGEAIYAPAFDAVYSRHLDGKKFGREWGAWEAMNYFTTAIGAISGGLLVMFFGFHTMFFAMGFFCLLSALYLCLLPRKVL